MHLFNFMVPKGTVKRMKNIALIAIIVLLMPFMVSVVFAAPTKPSVSGLGNLGDYTSTMPSPTYRMDTQPGAYPTNRWWGSAYIDNLWPNGNPSLFMSLGTSYLRFVHGGYPTGIEIANAKQYVRSSTEYAGQGSETLWLCISSVPKSIKYITPAPVKVKSFSDWAVTAEMRDTNNPNLRMTTTFLKGGVFVYNTFSPGTYPDLRLRIRFQPRVVTDGCMLIADNNGWWGIYAPSGTSYSLHDSDYAMAINLPATLENEEDRYVIVAYLGSKSVYPDTTSVSPIFYEYMKYAFNFITGTSVSWVQNEDSSITTTFNYTMTAKRTGPGFVSGQTLFALYPHQWRHLDPTSAAVIASTAIPDYNTLRGNLKIYKGNSFKTRYDFHGMLPCLSFEVPQSNRTNMNNYIESEKGFAPNSLTNNTYVRGKGLAKAANLIPVFHQAGKIAARNSMVQKLKTELASWYKGLDGHYFGYDSIWGGIIGVPAAYGSESYNDHHFHYGYFIYASAILAMFDPAFASDSQFKSIVDLVVKDFVNTDRNSSSFPFLRNFDVYEGHSWSSGKGSSNAGNDGTDQESISESMNAWAAVYLWGMATNNQDLIETAIYGYTTELAAAQEYYFDIYNETYPPRSVFSHRGGILYDGSLKYRVHWETAQTIAQERYGIWILPMTPSMLYMGYNTTAAQSYIQWMEQESDYVNGSLIWKDIFLRYKSLYNAPQALSEWHSWAPGATPEPEGSSLSFSYHFINFFNSLGSVSTDYYAKDSLNNSVPFTVMKKADNTRTFIAYNYSESTKTVSFHPRSGASPVPNTGTMEIPPRTMVKTSDFVNINYDMTNNVVIHSTNALRDVYSIYSDNFLGAVGGGGDAYNDGLSQDSWSGTIYFYPYNYNFAGSYEGPNFFSAKRTNQYWGGWGFSFSNGAGVDLSSFYGGKIEFSIRLAQPSTTAENFQVGIQAGSGEVYFTLKDLGFNQNITTWQTLSIPLNSAANPAITPYSLTYTNIPFCMLHNAGDNSSSQGGVEVFLDSILWKKADISNLFSLELKNREDGTSVSSFTWTDSDLRDPHAICRQYIEIDMNNCEDNNTWVLQIYTDNKHIVTSSGTDNSYQGTLTTHTVSGLVCNDYPARDMLPLSWRATASNVPDSDVTFDPDWPSPWFGFRDISSFDGTNLYKGHDYITVMNRKGFKWSQDANGGLFGAPAGDKKIRLFLMADLRYALWLEYYANIIIEYFNE